jgi:hypothetical protein
LEGKTTRGRNHSHSDTTSDPERNERRHLQRYFWLLTDQVTKSVLPRVDLPPYSRWNQLNIVPFFLTQFNLASNGNPSQLNFIQYFSACENAGMNMVHWKIRKYQSTSFEGDNIKRGKKNKMCERRRMKGKGQKRIEVEL